MDIKYLPLINMSSELKGAKLMMNRVIIEAEVKGRKAELVLTREEAKTLVESITAALAPRVS
jgi:hypothetical protein